MILKLIEKKFIQKKLNFQYLHHMALVDMIQHYEIEGKDYPLEYVRWTLNRNMKSYVNLIDSGKN